jgi:hypothetical protein
VGPLDWALMGPPGLGPSGPLPENWTGLGPGGAPPLGPGGAPPLGPGGPSLGPWRGPCLWLWRGPSLGPSGTPHKYIKSMHPYMYVCIIGRRRGAMGLNGKKTPDPVIINYFKYANGFEVELISFSFLAPEK